MARGWLFLGRFWAQRRGLILNGLLGINETAISHAMYLSQCALLNRFLNLKGLQFHCWKPQRSLMKPIRTSTVLACTHCSLRCVTSFHLEHFIWNLSCFIYWYSLYILFTKVLVFRETALDVYASHCKYRYFVSDLPREVLSFAWADYYIADSYDQFGMRCLLKVYTVWHFVPATNKIYIFRGL